MKAFHPIPLVPAWNSPRCQHLWAELIDGVETTHTCASVPDHRGRHRCACGARHSRISSDIRPVDAVRSAGWYEPNSIVVDS